MCLLIILILYLVLCFVLMYFFSIGFCGKLNSSNFECGFYSNITLTLRYKFNYWMIIIHFMIFEQELLFCFLLLFGLHSNAVYVFIIILILILFCSIISMVIDRNLLLKFFICYELFWYAISVNLLCCTCDNYSIVIILLLLWNSTFEAVLGLTFYSFLSFLYFAVFNVIM
jgi:NADH:ubiquinone oxidoreductase subunit 3 (subunit A)